MGMGRRRRLAHLPPRPGEDAQPQRRLADGDGGGRLACGWRSRECSRPGRSLERSADARDGAAVPGGWWRWRAGSRRDCARWDWLGIRLPGGMALRGERETDDLGLPSHPLLIDSSTSKRTRRWRAFSARKPGGDGEAGAESGRCPATVTGPLPEARSTASITLCRTPRGEGAGAWCTSSEPQLPSSGSVHDPLPRLLTHLAHECVHSFRK